MLNFKLIKEKLINDYLSPLTLVGGVLLHFNIDNRYNNRL